MGIQFCLFEKAQGSQENRSPASAVNRRVDLKVCAQLPARLPEESRKKERDDRTGKQCLGNLAFVAHNVYTLANLWLQTGLKAFTTNQAPCWRDRARDAAYIVGHFSGANGEKNNNGFTGKQPCPRGEIVRMWILVRKELLRNLFSLQLVVSSETRSNNSIG